ncbi:hypothetical protein QWT69_02160 [Sporosarcina oncorhynchi]|uniref:Uncharacterized protein n=1 Tax=Sporosarcina oncorhynchi TaxID=3056444 RepID=A0ABZ0L630_9BACL|nr:hypothetical protein [Sporosarcina sp. T2O-4]WOV87945.1 hypothetical protein QWT69_02160 [Sporosarcina sp. T2O-4]
MCVRFGHLSVLSDCPGTTFTGAATLFTGATPTFTGAATLFTGATPTFTGAATLFTGATPTFTGAATLFTGATPTFMGAATLFTGATPTFTGAATLFTSGERGKLYTVITLPSRFKKNSPSSKRAEKCHETAHACKFAMKSKASAISVSV